MKKIIISVLLALMGSLTIACADNDKVIRFEQLPEAAQQLVKEHFTDFNITTVTVDREIGGKTYDLYFANGCHIEFDGRGNWKEIDCKPLQVPDGVVPARILERVNADYPESSIVGIERGRRSHEVRLNNGLELTFDSKFNVTEIDR